MQDEDFQTVLELVHDCWCEPAMILKAEIRRRAIERGLETHPPTAVEDDNLIIAQVFFNAKVERIVQRREERRQNIDIHRITFPDGTWVYSCSEVVYPYRLDGKWTPRLVPKSSPEK